ncbi:MAG: WG repeat-containing protein [Clostridia bacterium]|nr:WG repeat-containing protein [Clostridia bacterium]
MKRLLVLTLLTACLAYALTPFAETAFPQRIPYESEEGIQYLVLDDQNSFQVLDSEGNVIRDGLEGYIEYDKATDTYLIRVGRQYGYLDGDGNWLFPLGFSYAGDFDENGIAEVRDKYGEGYVRSDGTYLFEPQFSQVNRFSPEGIATVVLNGFVRYVDINGNYVTDTKYWYGSDFSNGFAEVSEDGVLWGYIDTNGEYVTEIKYKDTNSFSEGLAAVSEDGVLWGYIDTTGRYVLEPQYTSAWSFINGVAVVLPYDRGFWDYSLIARDGSVLIEHADFIDVTDSGLITVDYQGSEKYYAFVNGVLTEISVVDNNMYLYDYYPFEGDKVVTLDSAADIIWDTEAPYPRLDGATGFLPTYAAFAQAVYPDDTRIDSLLKGDVLFRCTKTNKAYKGLINGDSDVIFVQGPSDAQLADAAAAGVEFELTLLGYESFVFIVNADNPLNEISVDQVRAIYSGALTNWEELGINGLGEIIAYQRPKNSGSQTALERLMGDIPLMEPPQEWVSDGMEDILTTVEYRNLPNALGYTFRFFCSGMVGSKVKQLALNGVEPTLENIRNGSYPVIMSLYAVSRKGEQNPNVRILLDWITGPQGQELVEKSGYVGTGVYTAEN